MPPQPLPARVEASRAEPAGKLALAGQVGAELRDRALRVQCLDYAAKNAAQGTASAEIIADAQKFYDYLTGKNDESV